MKITLISMTFVCATFTQLSHPIALMAVILVQTLGCCLMLTALMTSSWFSFILFLIFLGGLMVLFIYISSLASNEMFFFEPSKSMTTMIVFLISMMIILWFMNSQITSIKYFNEEILLKGMYSNNMAPVISMTMIYLLLTLIVVVKMTSKFEGPLRNMVYK